METKFDNPSIEYRLKSLPLSDEDFQYLITFFVTDNKEIGNKKSISEKKLFPIHFKKWQQEELSQNYPLCFFENDYEKVSRSLNEVFETLNSEFEQEKIEGSENIFKDLNNHVRSHLNGYSQEYMKKIWDKSIKSLLADIKKTEEKENTEKALALIQSKLNLNGKIASLSQNIPHLYFNTAIKKVWYEKSKNFSNVIDGLLVRLVGLIDSDKLKASGKSAKNLKSTIGGTYEDNLNFEALSDLLENSFVESNIPKERIERIQRIIKRLTSFKKYYSNFVSSLSEEKELFTQNPITLNECVKQFNTYKKKVVDFFCAIHVANLEISNKYKKEKHDTIFEDFHFSYLSAEDISNIPPFPLVINASQVKEKFYLLAQILETNFPVKILLEVNKLLDPLKSDVHSVKTCKWTRKLIGLAINLNDIFILQSTTNDLPRVEKEIVRGLSYSGPALYCIFNIPDKSYTGINHEFLYKAVSNSRAFPSWTYSALNQKNLSSRFDIKLNSDADKDWPTLQASFKSDEMEFSQSVFTFLDYMVNDPELSNKFISLRAEYLHENIIPLEEYLSLDHSETKNKLPFVLLADDDNHYYKVIPDSSLLQATYSSLNDWRTLQSLANISASAQEQPAEEEDPIIEKPAELSKDEVSRNAINNILARLISGDLEAKSDVAPQPIESAKDSGTPIEEAPPEAKIETAETVEEQGEIIEPYIDSALCTSCNDCININSMMFAYNEDMQATVKDVSKGSFKQLVMAAEKCPAEIIHPGKPKDQSEKDLDKLIERAEKYNVR